MVKIRFQGFLRKETTFSHNCDDVGGSFQMLGAYIESTLPRFSLVGGIYKETVRWMVGLLFGNVRTVQETSQIRRPMC